MLLLALQPPHHRPPPQQIASERRNHCSQKPSNHFCNKICPKRHPPRKRSALAPADFIDPCLPTRAGRAPVADGWVHEIKHDGIRLQIHARGKRVGLYTMTGVNWTERYPWIVEDVARLNLRHAILDAEGCCKGDNGHASFERLMARFHDASAYAYAFDLLALDDKVRIAFVTRAGSGGLAYLSGRCSLDGRWIGVFPVSPKNSRLGALNVAKHDLGGFAGLAHLVRNINSGLQRGLLGLKGGFVSHILRADDPLALVLQNDNLTVLHANTNASRRVTFQRNAPRVAGLP